MDLCTGAICLVGKSRGGVRGDEEKVIFCLGGVLSNGGESMSGLGMNASKNQLTPMIFMNDDYSCSTVAMTCLCH
jgi:hypothetical protein